MKSKLDRAAKSDMVVRKPRYHEESMVFMLLIPLFLVLLFGISMMGERDAINLQVYDSRVKTGNGISVNDRTGDLARDRNIQETMAEEILTQAPFVLVSPLPAETVITADKESKSKKEASTIITISKMRL